MRFLVVLKYIKIHLETLKAFQTHAGSQLLQVWSLRDFGAHIPMTFMNPTLLGNWEIWKSCL